MDKKMENEMDTGGIKEILGIRGIAHTLPQANMET